MSSQVDTCRSITLDIDYYEELREKSNQLMKLQLDYYKTLERLKHYEQLLHNNNSVQQYN